MKLLKVLKRLIIGVTATITFVAFIIITTADREVPINYWLLMVGVFAVFGTITVLLVNPYAIMSIIMPASVCVGAFMYDKLHIRFSKTLHKCYKILKHEGSYSRCYRTGVKVYDEYVQELENNIWVD